LSGLFNSRSPLLRLTLLGIAGIFAGPVLFASMLTPDRVPSSSQLAGVALVGVIAVALWSLAAYRLLRPLCRLHEEHDRAATALSARTHTVDRLLEFSQTVQGAGKPQQIHQSLAHYLYTELSLAGVAVLCHDPDGSPSIQVPACRPEDLLRAESLAVELETAMCPCLRQNLPRQFRPDGAPARCAVDRGLRLVHPVESYAAYCIPFTIGRKAQCVVHMLLPVGECWTEPLRQLAHTYVNTAHAALTSLSLLEDAEQRSMTDPLTQLYNRRSLDQLLEREVALAERHGHPFSVAMIDLDRFKQINDAHGHAAGDYVLKAFADCVRITLRRTDLAFRYGGDEFVIALPQTPLAQAQQVMHKLRQAFAAVDFSDAIANLQQQPTLSMGVAERSAAGNVLTLASLLAAADQALYEAKHAQRNCIRTHHPHRAA